MPNPQTDDSFARQLLQLRTATDAQIGAARAEQARLAALGDEVSLAEVLVRLGTISAEIRDNVEKLIGVRAAGVNSLGQYALLKKLGEGGMGTVYLAEDSVSQRKVALKVLPKRLSADSSVLARFQREAKSTAKLNHENIVAAYTTGEEKGYHYFVMEFCEGEPLNKKIKRKGFLPWERAVNIAHQTACGLKHAHDHGIIHRDIKPANLCVQSTGLVKILDMGLSKSMDSEGSSFNTQSGAVLGTPHYLSPEQAIGDKNIDGRSDIYSLGATLYNMLTGQTPFQGSSAAIVMMKHINEQLSNPQDIREEIPDGVVLVIRKMMAKAPGDRYRSCDELLADLELLLQGKMPQFAPLDDLKSSIALPKGARNVGALAARKRDAIRGVTADRVYSPAHKSRRLMYAGAGAAVLLIVGLVAFNGRNSDPTPSKGNPEPSTISLAATTTPPASPIPQVTSDPRPNVAVQPLAAKKANAEWQKTVQALGTPEERLAEVIKRLKALNPGYDGVETHKVEEGIVSELILRSSALQDISPLAALGGLKVLICEGVVFGNAPVQPHRVTDLSPLEKLPLERLSMRFSAVSDLSPLKGGPSTHLTFLNISNTPVSDLAPLSETSVLTQLICRDTKVRSLEPLRPLKLVYFDCSGSPVESIDPLRGNPLEHVALQKTNVTDISPLAGKALSFLDVESTAVRDLTPLKGAPVTNLHFTARNTAEAAAILYFPKLELVNDMSPKLFGGKFLISLPPPAVADAAKENPPQVPPPPAVQPTPAVQPPGAEPSVAPNAYVSIDIARACNAEYISTFSHVYDAVANFYDAVNWETVAWQKAMGKKETGLPDDGRIEMPETKSNYFQLITASPRNAIKLTTAMGTQPRAAAIVLPQPQVARYAKIAVLHSANGFGTLRVQVRYDSGAPDELRLSMVDSRGPVSLPAEHLAPAAAMFNAIHNLNFNMHAHTVAVDPKRALRSLTFSIDAVDKARIAEANFIGSVFAVSALPAAAAGIPLGAEIARPKALDDVDEAWIKTIQALPAKEQARQVADKLKELNPGYSGAYTSKEELNQVAELTIQSDALENIAPVRALARLKRLDCSGIADAEKGNRYSKLADLSPLKKLNLLSRLNLGATSVEDLSPLKSLSLYELDVSNTLVHDLAPVKGAQLRVLNISNTAVSSLAPLQGMKLERLNADGCSVADLAPLKSMPMRELNVSRTQVASLSPLASAPLEILSIAGSQITLEEAPKLAALPLKTFSASDDYLEIVSQTLKQSRTLAIINGQTMAEFHFKYPDVLLHETFERIDMQRPPPAWSLTQRQAFSIVEKRGRGKVLCINNKTEISGTPSLDIALDTNKLKGRTIILSMLGYCPGGFTTAVGTDKPLLFANFKLAGKPSESPPAALEPGLAHLDWIPIKIPITVPANATALSVCLKINHIPIEAFFDDLKVELVPVQAPEARK